MRISRESWHYNLMYSTTPVGLEVTTNIVWYGIQVGVWIFACIMCVAAVFYGIYVWVCKTVTVPYQVYSGNIVQLDDLLVWMVLMIINGLFTCFMIRIFYESDAWWNKPLISEIEFYD